MTTRPLPLGLTALQADTLAQFQAVTARDDSEACIEVLDEVGWDLQAAISRIYDSGPSTPAPPRHSYPPARDDPATVDDALLPTSSVRSGAGRRRSPAPGTSTGGLGTGAVGLYYLRQVLAVPITILAWPASVLYNLGAVILTFLARILRLRPSTASFRPRNPFSTSHRRPRTILSPTAASERWIQSVERLTGLPRAAGESTAPSAASGVEIGSSSGLSRRAGASRAQGATLPEFFVGGYEHALRKARDEMRLMMVVLTCEENDADEAFKRDVLTNEELVKALNEENVLVWGGDVMERDAYQVGRTLSYTSLPFIAFISLQPSSSPGSTSSSPRLSLITRLEPTPSTPSLSASLVHTHLVTAVLPKSKPYLSRLAQQKLAREQERRRREEAERRENETARRDEERILALRRRDDERKRDEAQRRERDEREARERAEKERVAELAQRWRRWKRRELALRGEPEGAVGAAAAIKVVVRLGNGRRVMRSFAGDEPTEEVYAWVECELGEEEDGDGPSLASEEQPDAPPPGYQQTYHFRLATTFPRSVVHLPSHLASPSSAHLDTTPSDAGESEAVKHAFEGMGRNVNLVVEGLEERRRMSLSSREEEDDEEEEEEEE
ncbi:hypothetical protein JCM5296_002457 [Sporobolomyces johnsonii]